MSELDWNDDAAALDAVMHYFWTHGYEASDIDALALSAGLKREDLLHRFGNKHALFRKAVDHYLDVGFDRELESFETGRAPLATLGAVFDEIVAPPDSSLAVGGRVRFSSGLDVAPYDTVFQQAIADVLVKFQTFLRNRIAAGQQQGAISNASSPDDLAKLLLGAMIGARVLARMQPKRDELVAIARSALSILTDDETQA
ncbi:TetR family transcriptional regulator [Pararobbsia alpina]|uniref:TetR/AcrR family transcriptional regulator n=1 Tax=Pararobbsia alpina TaxID=621374 RepID=UPI0039A74CDB